MSKKRRRSLKTSTSPESKAAAGVTQTPQSSPGAEPGTSTETEAVTGTSTTETGPVTEAAAGAPPATPSPTGPELATAEQPSDAEQPTQDERDAGSVVERLSPAQPEDVPAESSAPDQVDAGRGADQAAGTRTAEEDEPGEPVEPAAQNTPGGEVEAEPAEGTATRGPDQVSGEPVPAPQSAAPAARSVPEPEPADELEPRQVDEEPGAARPVDEAQSRDEAPRGVGAGEAPEAVDVGSEAGREPDSAPDRQPEVVGEPDRTAPIEEDEAAPEAARPAIEREEPSPPRSTSRDWEWPAPSPEPSSAAQIDTAAVPVGVTEEEAEEAGRPVARPAEGVAAWRRLVRMGQPRATKANVLGALLAVLLGLAIATQVQLTQERGLSELSQTDLIRVLDDLSVRSSRLDDQIRELEATRDRLKSGTGSSAEALAQAQKRADSLAILAGTVGATGPGITVTLSDPDRALTGPIVLDLIQELRDAGAEAIEVGGVRVVASSFIGEVDGEISVDGVRVPRPVLIKAIGDSDTLSSAMTIPGGIVETVRQKGATAKVTKQPTVQITALHQAKEPKHAQPAG